jgi:hypothetical protein
MHKQEEFAMASRSITKQQSLFFAAGLLLIGSVMISRPAAAQAPVAQPPGVAYSASDSDGLVGTLDLDNGVVTPIVTGLGSARGMLFVRPDHHDNSGGDDRQELP